MLEEYGVSAGEVDTPPVLDEEQEESDREEDVKHWGNGTDRLRLDDTTGELTEYGPTSVFKHLPSPSTSAPLPRHSPVSTMAPSQSLFGNDPPFNNLSVMNRVEDLPELLLSPQIHEEALTAFFTYFNSWCYFVQEREFRRDLTEGAWSHTHTFIRFDTRTAYYSPLLHYSILALGLTLLPNHILSNRRELSDRMISRAKSLMEVEVQQPMLSTVTGLMMLGSCHSCSGRHTMGYIYAGIALRLVQALGLGINCSRWVENGSIEPATRKARDHVFYISYIQDKLWSFYVGRGVSLSMSNNETPLPSIDEEEDELPWSIPNNAEPMKSWISTTFVFTCKLFQLAEKVLNTVYSLRLNTSSDKVQNSASELNVLLEEWYGSLPSALRITAAVARSAQSRIPPAHIILLHGMYHFIVILLHRPWYIRPGQPTESREGKMSGSVKRCDQSANRILQMVSLYDRSVGLRYGPISMTQMVFTAGTIHLLDATSNSRSRESKKLSTSLTCVKMCIEALHKMGDGFLCSKHSAVILQRLMDEWSLLPDDAPSNDEQVSGRGETETELIQAESSGPIKEMLRDPRMIEELRKLGWAPPPSSSSPSRKESSAAKEDSPDPFGVEKSSNELDALLRSMTSGVSASTFQQSFAPSSQSQNAGWETMGAEQDTEPDLFGLFNIPTQDQSLSNFELGLRMGVGMGWDQDMFSGLPNPQNPNAQNMGGSAFNFGNPDIGGS
nr:uncharacterized protein I303_01187 [Kwoniella dejecticola CBS 10117]OBR89360.1 hypothetical protein I303_01187 [Kwoniella dejecticola CBS 10117]